MPKHHADYLQVYERDFYQRADGITHWQAGEMRTGDALAAVGYAVGVSSFEELRSLVPFEGEGRGYVGKSALEQLACLPVRRQPKSVLDVGGGRGEVAWALSQLGARVQLVEPHPLAADWLQRTASQFKAPLGDVKLINELVPECLDSLELNSVDTVLFVESIEHIPDHCFEPFWEKVKPALVANSGRLIVTNWLSYFPLDVSGPEHCRLVDSQLYARLAEGGRVVFQQGAHLVVDYWPITVTYGTGRPAD